MFTRAGDNFGKYKKNIEAFCAKNVQERVYVHFDNTSYNCGEYMWYKAYVVRDDSLTPTPPSRYLHVELLSPAGLPVVSQCLKIEDGQAAGCMQLADTLRSGFYEVRAYTAWMLNFSKGDRHGWKKFDGKAYKREYGDRLQHYLDGNAGLFSRVFPVYEVDSLGERKITTPAERSRSTSDVVVDFYPEGGNMVEGVPCTVAFQAHDKAGCYRDVTGRIVAGDATIVANVESEHEGRGSFLLSADDLNGDKELAFVVGDKRFPLPKPIGKGYALSVESGNGKVNIKAERNYATHGTEMYLLVTCRQRVVSFERMNMKKQTAETVVTDISKMGTGVNVVTLLSEDGHIVAQRELFINNGIDAASATVECAVPDNLPMDSDVVLDFAVKDSKGHSAIGTNVFSCSVLDGGKTDMTYYTDNILTYMLLSSEVKGFIPNAAYYFEKDDDAHKRALDQLLLVQGWTRYNFRQMIGEEQFKPDVLLEKELQFAGRLYNTDDFWEMNQWKKVKKRLWMYGELLLDDNSTITSEAQLDKGYFKLSFPDFMGTAKLFVFVNDKSVSQIGNDKAGVAGHVRSRYVEPYMEGKAIVPLNVYCTLPKKYSWYETLAFGGVASEKGERPYSLIGVFDKWVLENYLQNAYGRLQIGENKIGGVYASYDNVFELLGVDGLTTYRDGNGAVLGAGLNMDPRYKNTARVYFRPSAKNCIQACLYANVVNRSQIYTSGNYGEIVGYDDIRRRYIYHTVPKGRDKCPVTSHIDYVYAKIGHWSNNTHWSRYGVGTYSYSFMGLLDGLDRPVEFFHQDYSGTALPEEKKSRTRTLYWNPSLKTDTNGKAQIRLKTGSLSGKIVISAEGITKDGHPIVYRMGKE